MSETIETTQEKCYRIRPFGNYVAIELIEEEGEKTSKGGIILATTGQAEKPQLAAILEVGPGLISMNGDPIPMQAKKGDIVLINRHAPMKMELPDKSFIHFVGEGDIICALDVEENAEKPVSTEDCITDNDPLEIGLGNEAA